MSVTEVQEAGLDFFFDMIKWCWYFLTRVTVLGVPVLFIFLGIIVIGIVMAGLLNNSTKALGAGISSERRRRQKSDRKK